MHGYAVIATLLWPDHSNFGGSGPGIERREERMFGTRHTIQQQLFVQNYAAHSASEPTLVDTI